MHQTQAPSLRSALGQHSGLSSIRSSFPWCQSCCSLQQRRCFAEAADATQRASRSAQPPVPPGLDTTRFVLSTGLRIPPGIDQNPNKEPHKQLEDTPTSAELPEGMPGLHLTLVLAALSLRVSMSPFEAPILTCTSRKNLPS